jgi:hypothetical protein
MGQEGSGALWAADGIAGIALAQASKAATEQRRNQEVHGETVGTARTF